MNSPSLIEEHFLAALEKGTPEERAAYLDEACKGFPALRRQVERLLEAHPKAGDFLEKPLLAPTVDSAPGEAENIVPSPVKTGIADPTMLAETLGSRIGPYKILQLLGEGGMGAVYVAEQEHPVKRRVALKVIKPGMDSAQVLRRFQAEQQALALMDHTNIAKVLDAGSTPPSPPSQGGELRGGGRPYFVMELVKGVPITKYCDELHLPLRERLALFVPVCQAIQHAHQKGIIHRDIKPSNVLVCMQDGKPVPKVIDFGVAKALHQNLTDQSMYTEIGQMIGTLEYMSPEQAELSTLDIDTRADVYALGVLMYELLTGSTPLDRKRLKKAAFTEMLRIIREEEPPKPSTRLTDSKDSLPSLAAQRRTEPAKLTREVRGELDWIVMKCLEKDRTRRYETANGLARDIERHLHDEAVEACPPSAGYRLKKALRRHKGPVLAAALVLAALVVGVVGLGWGLVQADHGRQLAEQGEQDAKAAALAEAKAKEEALQRKQEAEEAAAAERLAKESAQKRLAQIEKGTEIIGSIFKDLDPKAEEKEGKELRVLLGERLDGAVKQLEGESVGDPVAVARLQLTLGRSLLGLGYTEKAIGLFTKARATCTTHLGPDHADTLESMNSLAVGFHDAGKLDLALPLHEETLKLRKAKLGADHLDTLYSTNNLASCRQAAGKLDLALPMYEEALKLMKAKLGPEHPDTLTIMNNLAGGYQADGKLDLALPLYEEALKRIKAMLGPEHPSTLQSMNNLAAGYQTAGKLDLALPLFEETLKLRKAKLGADHPGTLESMNNLAVCYAAAGKLDLALPLNEETLKLSKAKLGPDHPVTLNTMNSLAALYWQMKNLDQSIPLFEQTLKRQVQRLGTDHPSTLHTKANLGVNYCDAGRLEEAIPLLKEALQLQEAKLGADHPDTLTTMNRLASCYQADGKLHLALPLFEETLKLRKAKLGPDHPDTLTSMSNLASCYQDAGMLDLAIPLYEETLMLRKAKLRLDHPDTLTSMNNLARCYQDADKLDLATPLFEETLKLRKVKLGSDHSDTLTSMNNLAGSYRAAGKLNLALPLNEETLKLSKAKLGHNHPMTLTSMNNLAECYVAAGKLDLALPLHEETFKLRKAKLGAEHPDTLTSMNNLASCYQAAGKLNLALPLFEQTLKLMKAKRGADHTVTLTTMNNLAGAYQAVGKLDLALPLYEETLKLRKAKLGADHPDTLRTMNDLAGAYQAVGKLDLALPLNEETLKLSKGRLGLNHPDTLRSMNNLAALYWRMTKLDKSIPLFEETLKLVVQRLGADHPDTLGIKANLGVNYRDAGRLKEAIPLLEEAYKKGTKHTALRWVGGALVTAYLSAGMTAEAMRLIPDDLKFARAALSPESPQLAKVLATNGLSLLKLNAWTDAESILRECLAIREKKAPEDWTTFNTKSLLGGALLGQKKYADAEPLLVAGYNGMKEREAKIPAQGRIRLTEAVDRLIELYTATNKADEVEKWRTEKARQLIEEKLEPAAIKKEARNDPFKTAERLLAEGKHAEAIQLLEKEYRERKAKLGQDHPDTRFAKYQLGKAHLERGEPIMAIKVLEEVLVEMRRPFPEDPNLTAVRFDLARAYQAAGKLDLALPLFEETLKQRKDPFKTAEALLAEGKHAEAIQLLEKEYRERKAKLGQGHPDTRFAMYQLGKAHLERGEPIMAIEVLEHVLVEMRRPFPEDPNLTAVRFDIARALQAAGKLDLALQLFEETLKLQKAKLGPDHPDTLRTMSSLATVWCDQGKYDRAMTLQQEVVEAQTAKLGAEHPDTLKSRSNLAWTYQRMGKLDAAEELFVPVLEAQRRVLGAEHPHTVGSMANLGGNWLLQKKYAQAEPLLRECLAIREKKAPEEWATFATKSALGSALLGQKKYADAEPLLVQGYAGLKERALKIPPSYRYMLSEAVERLVQLYDTWGKPDDAAKWRKEWEARKDDKR